MNLIPVFLSRLYLPADVTRIQFGIPRSSSWRIARRNHLKTFPRCALCNTLSEIEVHHVTPYHIAPDRELDPENLLTLCRPHHFLFGHFLDWTAYNPDILQDVSDWRAKILSRPRTFPGFFNPPETFPG